MNVWCVPYPKFGAGPGLDRVAAIAEHLGIDLSAFGESGAVIVGSNGKGSTAAMTAALLQTTGASVGLFTSPHLFALNERFRIDDADIADEELARHWTRVEQAVAESGLADQFGGFEFLFLIAADWFRARECDYTVWEAGIGGRLDPVRLIRARRLALTSLDLEHTELLGTTLQEIGLDKIEAASPGAKLFAAPLDPEADALARRCAEMGVDYQTTPPLNVAVIPLAGAHQQQNAALAVALATSLAPLSGDEVARGLAATRWPGRLETISDAPLVVIDVGHTPAAIAAALDGFRSLRGSRDAVLVCGASLDKDAAAIIGALAVEFPTIICASAGHKGAPAAQIAAHASATNPQAELIVAESVSDARRLALSKAGPEGAIFVAGGLFLAAEFKAVHFGRDPATLAFF